MFTKYKDNINKLNYIIEHVCNFCSPHRGQIAKDNINKFNEFKSKSIERDWKQTTVYSMDEFTHAVKDFSGIKTVYGRQWKKNLHTDIVVVYWLYLVSKNKDYILEIPMSTHNVAFTERLGNPTNVSRSFKRLEKLGIIKRIPYDYKQTENSNGSKNGDYYWGTNGTFYYDTTAGYIELTDTKLSMCYRYIINVPAIKLYLTMYKHYYGDYKWKPQTDILDEECKEYEEEFLKLEKKYTNKIKLGCLYGVYLKDFDNNKIKLELFCYWIIKRNKKSFSNFIEKREVLNMGLPEQLQGHYRLKFHYSKSGLSLTKIGIRDWNYFCNYKKHFLDVNDESEFFETSMLLDIHIQTNKKNFYTELKNQFGWDKKDVYENDVSSSVPKMLYLTNYGEWLPQSVDMYEKIYGLKYPNEMIRKCFKYITLPAIFTQSRDKFIYNVKLHYTKLELQTYQANKDYYEVPDVADMAGYVWDKVHSMFPNIDGTDIFRIESEVYMLVEEVLQKAGIKYVKVYDCFYTNVKINNFDEILAQCANYYKENS